MSDEKNYSAVLVEDEQPTRELIIDYIMARPELYLKGVAKNGGEALKELSTKQVDLAFMDIDLPVMSGLEVLEKLEKLPYLIFITVSREHALRAFEIGAIDYLNKPFSQERFNRAVDRALLFLNKDEAKEEGLSHGSGLVVTEEENHHLLSFSEIIYISSHDRRTAIHTESRDYETPRLLQEMEKKLPAKTFMRIHKQFIVNVNYIVRFQYYIGGRYIVFLKDSDETNLPVSRKYAPLFKKRFDL